MLRQGPPTGGPLDVFCGGPAQAATANLVFGIVQQLAQKAEI